MGVIFDSSLSFRTYVNHLRNKATFVLNRLYLLISKRSKMSQQLTTDVIQICIRPIMTYVSVMFTHTNKDHSWSQKNLTIPSECLWCVHNVVLYKNFELESLKEFCKGLAKPSLNSFYRSSAYALRPWQLLWQPRCIFLDPYVPITAYCITI